MLVLATLVAQRALPDVLAPPEQATDPAPLLDREGRPVQLRYDGGWNRVERLPLESVPLLLREAFIHAEDRRYWAHGGVDWRARGAAVIQQLRGGRRGASTISEQVVRILHPRPRTLWSRWVEGFEAMRLEARFPKAEILAFYLDQVPYGANRRGVAAAARYYFGRSVDTLSPPEMLALAVLVRAPSRLAADPQALQRRVQRLAAEMPDGVFGSTFDRAQLTQPLQLMRAQPALSAAHFAAWARHADCGRPGARWRSSLDAKLQADAEVFVRERLRDLAREGARQGAALLVDLDGNRVRAWASVDLDAPDVVGIDAVRAPRQPGSTLKPLLYALSFERGWRADTLIDDDTLREAVGGGLHEYRNYSRVHYGQVTVAEALGNSLNVPAVKALQFVGQDAFLARLQALGVQSLREQAAFYGDGLALGNGALSLFELVQAYTALARDGAWQPLSACEDSRTARPVQGLITRDAARAVTAILADPQARLLEFGDGGVLRFAQRTAVKTGTSSDYRDAWTLAYNGRWLVGVWVGNLSGAATSGVTGVRGPALLARSLLARVPAETGLPAPAPLPAAAAPVPVAAAPERPQLLQPFDGLLLARDPRIPDELEAFSFELSWREPLARVRWEVDGRPVAETKGARYAWPLVAGEHRVRAIVTSAAGRVEATAEARFTVR